MLNRIQAISVLLEGSSIRAVARMTGISRNTVTSLLVAVGTACAAYQDKALRNVTSQRTQTQKIWTLCYEKDRNLPGDKQDKYGYGTIWTWVTLDTDSKLVCSWTVGKDDRRAVLRIPAAEQFRQAAARLSKRVGNHLAAISLHIMFYNFVQVSSERRRVTPAMAAGVTDRMWDVADIVALLDTEKRRRPNYQDEAHYGPALGFNPGDQYR